MQPKLVGVNSQMVVFKRNEATENEKSNQMQMMRIRIIFSCINCNQIEEPTLSNTWEARKKNPKMIEGSKFATAMKIPLRL